MKYFLTLIFFLNLAFANENKVVKTSELELFLFKIGFESLLKDVDITKEKSQVNEESLKKLSKKIEYIMSEIKKDKILIKNDDFSNNTQNNISNEEIKTLKVQIQNLQEQINTLKNQKNKRTLNTSKKQAVNTKFNFGFALVDVEFLDVRKTPYISSKTLRTLKRGTKVEIQFCDKYKWCKIKGEEAYLPQHLLSFL